MKWNRLLRLVLYLMGLGWTFLGVGVISDIFMVAIEKITSSKKRVMNNKTGRMITVYVWNATVANLTLMALGSSAPEILLSLIEITGDEFFLGPLGAGTIVGSAAFNLLVISAVCVCAIPDGEVRYIKEVPVYVITATTSVFAYLWLIFILMVTTPDVCDVWEGVLTLLFCPAFVFASYLADRGYFTKKKAEGEHMVEDHVLAISDNATQEELAEVEAEIRDRHGANLTQEQVVKLMKVEYCGKHTRAWYRHQAMNERLHGKHIDTTPVGQPDAVVQEVLNTTDDVTEEQKKKTVIIGAASDKYAYLENVGKAKVSIVRMGPTECKAFVKYKTRDGTATAPSDYDYCDGTVTFEKGETSKDIFIPIKDDTSFENDESFFVDLTEPGTEESAGCRAQLWETHTTVEVTIIDDDMPGELSFVVEDIEVVEGTADQTVQVAVQRKNGATGKIKCNYKTETMQNAVEGADYEAAKGEVEFEDGQQEAKIEVVVKSRGRANKGTFNVVLEEPEGCKFDAKTDGGEEQCICHVIIKSGADKSDMFKQMAERLHSANSIMGHKNWAQQFKDALFEIGDGDDEEEEGEEGAEKQPPSKVDIFIHVLTVPWKLLFAFVPPVDYCGGWACFVGSLCMIAVVTAIVGDMANLVGCSFGVLPETAAITFVALGTSLPDTFASQTAAKMDPYADASIGNVTGSNSVNVFLGVGIAWTLAAVYWSTQEITADSEWTKRFMKITDSAVKENVAKAVDGGTTPVFITPAGTIWFNLMVFCLNAFCALQHLFARRKKWGGELGGPKKGVMGQYFSGGFLIAQWCIYIIASIIFSRTQDPLTYQAIAAD